LKSEDVFIIDNGTKIYQYNGSSCSHDEKFKAAEIINNMKEERKGNCRVVTLEEKITSPDHPALMLLKEGKSKPKGPMVKGTKEMFVVSDADGSLNLAKVDGYGKDMLNSDDVFVINSGEHVYCWIGKVASVDERKNALAYASNYLNKTATPWLPISVVAEGKESAAFNDCW